MKSTQLLSVVLSLIMFTGVTVGSTAFADSEYYEELEDFCDMTEEKQFDFLAENPDVVEYEERLAEICTIEDFEERYTALDDLIDEIIPETRDNDDFDEEFDELEDEFDEMEDEANEIDEMDLDDRLELFCNMDNDELDMLFADYPELVTFNDTLVSFCDLSFDEREEVIDDFIDQHFSETRDDDYDDEHDGVIDDFEDCVDAGFPIMESYPEQCMIDDGTVFVNDEDDDREDYMHDKYSNKGQGNLHDRFAMHCDLTAEERTEKINSMHVDLPDDLRDDLLAYCDMTDDEQDDFRDKIMDHMDVMLDRMKDRSHIDSDMRKHMDRFCDMSEDEQLAYLKEHDKPDDKAASIIEYCTLDEGGRDAFIDEHRDEYRSHMKDKYHDMMGKFDEKMHEKMDKITDKHFEKMIKYSEKSDRLQSMIKAKYDISDERLDEIKMKYREKHGDMSDEYKSEIKMKFKKHMSEFKFKHISDERKSEIHQRLAEMKAFKAELREKASTMTNEEKQQLREDFIEKAKDMQLAWISPRTQMTAGVDPTEVECREGFSLVMKASSGVAMCLKADTALKMIDRGIVVPAN